MTFLITCGFVAILEPVQVRNRGCHQGRNLVPFQLSPAFATSSAAVSCGAVQAQLCQTVGLAVSTVIALMVHFGLRNHLSGHSRDREEHSLKDFISCSLVSFWLREKSRNFGS